MADDTTNYCPIFQHAVELIGRRWTASILKVLGDRSLRFSEIRSAIPGLSDRLLDARLTELESEGILVRSVSDSEIRYVATEVGLELGPIFESIGSWAAAAACGDAAADRPGRRRC